MKQCPKKRQQKMYCLKQYIILLTAPCFLRRYYPNSGSKGQILSSQPKGSPAYKIFIFNYYNLIVPNNSLYCNRSQHVQKTASILSLRHISELRIILTFFRKVVINYFFCYVFNNTCLCY